MSMINRKCNYTTSDSVPWREEFPEYKDEDLPGVCLRGSRHKEVRGGRKSETSVNVEIR